MLIAKDKQMHLIGALVVMAWLLAMLMVYASFGVPAALLVGSLVGPGLEVYQLIRKEGTPDPADAITTMAPFIVAAAVADALDWRWF